MALAREGCASRSMASTKSRLETDARAKSARRPARGDCSRRPTSTPRGPRRPCRGVSRRRYPDQQQCGPAAGQIRGGTATAGSPAIEANMLAPIYDQGRAAGHVGRAIRPDRQHHLGDGEDRRVAGWDCRAARAPASPACRKSLSRAGRARQRDDQQSAARAHRHRPPACSWPNGS